MFTEEERERIIEAAVMHAEFRHEQLEKALTEPIKPQIYVYEILVPTVRNDGRPIRTRFHRVWDRKVKEITGGLTVMTPVQGQWVAPDGTNFNERMIPVRIACTEEQIERIADMTAEYYSQLAVMYYLIASEVRIKHYESKSEDSDDGRVSDGDRPLFEQWADAADVRPEA